MKPRTIIVATRLNSREYAILQALAACLNRKPASVLRHVTLETARRAGLDQALSGGKGNSEQVGITEEVVRH